MRYAFPYDDFGPVEIPEGNPVSLYPVPSVSPAAGEAELIRRAVAEPIGMARFSRRVGAGKRVLILVDDVSRPTPVDKIVPEVLRELERGGVAPEDVRFLIALGTHRPMTPAEVERKVGREVAARYEVVNHAWDDPAELHDYGALPDGTRAVLNRRLREADFVIGVGGIAPHPVAGFSGGGKIVAPGVAAEEAVGEFHWQGVQRPQRELLGVRDNPMREQIDRIAALAGLSAIVNVVQDGEGRIVHVVAGDPVEAHRRGAAFALDVHGVHVPDAGGADILIADTHPLDQDLWQGVKAMCALDCIAPDGSAVVVVSPSPEGVARQHPGVLRHGYVPLSRAAALLREGKVDKVTAHNMVQGGRLVSRTTAFLVSPGVTPAEAGRLGFRHCATAQEALDAAIALKGPASRIVILRMGGEICPIVP